MASPRVIKSAKRARSALFEEVYDTEIEIENESNGSVEIKDSDAEGKFVVLFNKGQEEVSVAGWQIVREAAGKKIPYKLPRNTVIAPGATVTIWSANQKKTAAPPAELVSKSNWLAADEMKTILLDGNGAVQAQREAKKTLRASKRSRQTLNGTSEDESKCMIM
jgi:lamin B